MMIYLDNAATSYPKPPVFEHLQVNELLLDFGNPHRGGHSYSRNAESLIFRVKNKLAKLINAPSANNIAICYNTTDALNQAFHGVYQENADNLMTITSVNEHNSVLRPIYRAKNQGQTDIAILKPNADDLMLDLEQLARLLSNNNNALVALSHVSNTLGVEQDIERIGQLCKKYNARFLVDGAQSVGHNKIDVQAANIDFLTFPAHKGLLGPSGLGFLYLSNTQKVKALTPLCVGGSGGDSSLETGPEKFPESHEVGTTNIHGLAMFEKSLDWLKENGSQTSDDKHAYLLTQLMKIPNLTLYTPPNKLSLNSSIALFNIDGWDSNLLASILDSSFDIAVRAGLHCAPQMHKWLSTGEHGGAVRVSLGLFNTKDDIDNLISALLQITQSNKESVK